MKLMPAQILEKCTNAKAKRNMDHGLARAFFLVAYLFMLCNSYISLAFNPIPSDYGGWLRVLLQVAANGFLDREMIFGNVNNK